MPAASRSHAPADHFNPARAQVSDLNASVVNLRSALPVLSRLAAGCHHGHADQRCLFVPA